MSTANLALVVVAVFALVAVFSTGGIAPRFLRWFEQQRAEWQIHREKLRQEQLKTALLEEQLRNEILRDPRERPPRTPGQPE